MRWIPPLEDDEWNALIADLEKGPSDEQIKFVKNAIKEASKLRVEYD